MQRGSSEIECGSLELVRYESRKTHKRRQGDNNDEDDDDDDVNVTDNDNDDEDNDEVDVNVTDNDDEDDVNVNVNDNDDENGDSGSERVPPSPFKINVVLATAAFFNSAFILKF